jgi:hypothetical protein
MRIYLLSDYEEHGATNVVGTTNPAKLADVLREHWPSSDAEVEQLANALAENTVGKWDLSSMARTGWGGIQLHILDIE